MVSFFADYYVNQRIDTTARRTFVFVEIADDVGPAFVHEVLSRLSQLAQNSDFSICVASGYHPEIIEEENVISILVHLRNSGDILHYVNLNLVADWEERDKTVTRIGQRAAGVFLWAEIVVNILNAAVMEGATREVIEYTLDRLPGDLHGLYEWMLSTLNERERAESLVLFQWAMLAAEPMRLSDLSVAVRLTDPDPFALYKESGPMMALNIGAPFSMRELRQLRRPTTTSNTPQQFHRWLRARSVGLLEIRPDSRQPAVNEPLGLQRVQPIHNSVRSFFLSGRGFACLSAGHPSIPRSLSPADFTDISYYAMLRACLTYLNMREFESLDHGARRHDVTDADETDSDDPKLDTSLPLRLPLPVSVLQYHPPPTVSSQRHQIMSRHPFLRYAVEHLVFHLLAPSVFRHFLPQRELLRALSARRFRLWARWTALLGTRDPDVILALAAHAAHAAPLLSPVFAARFRLERVLRSLARLAAEEAAGPAASGLPSSCVSHTKGMLVPVMPVGPAAVDDDDDDDDDDAPVGAIGEGEDTGHKTEAEAERGWSPKTTPRFRLPPELSLPLPTVGGSLLSPFRSLGSAKVLGEGRDGEEGGAGVRVGMAV